MQSNFVFQDTLRGSKQGAALLFPHSQARCFICFSLFVSDKAWQVISAGWRTHICNSSLVMDEQDQRKQMKKPRFAEHRHAAETAQVKRYERCFTACQPDSGGCFKFITAAARRKARHRTRGEKGSDVCMHPNLGFLTQRRESCSLKPFAMKTS